MRHIQSKDKDEGTNMSFTSWSDFQTEIQNTLVAGDVTAGTISKGDKSITYRSLDELARFLKYVEGKAAADNGAYHFRSYAKNAGRGYS